VSLKNLLFKKTPSSSIRHELLKIDGRMLEVRVRLNPRARRMIVKVNPATGEISVTAPSRRGLAHALDFARGEKDWIAGQIAKAPGPVLMAPGAVMLISPVAGLTLTIMRRARGLSRTRTSSMRPSIFNSSWRMEDDGVFLNSKFLSDTVICLDSADGRYL